MNHVDVAINAVGDPPVFKELEGRILCEGAITKMAILERGTASGKTSVCFYVETKSENYVLVQMTAAMLLTIAGAVKRAVDRFVGK